MIKINLLPQKKSRKVDPGQQSLLAGFLVVLVAGALVFFFVHKPLSEDIAKLEDANRELRKDNDKKKKKVEPLKELKATYEAAKANSEAIAQLNSARAIPAHMLHELGRILTTTGRPTMTNAMADRMSGDDNRKLAADWDPKHIWVTEFAEKNGEFRLVGGAQSDGDMTQLAKRLQASVYFQNVVPEGGQETIDKASGITYYQFVITGKVVY